MAVATENPIRLEMTAELANRVIIPPDARNDRTATALDYVALEIAASTAS